MTLLLFLATCLTFAEDSSQTPRATVFVVVGAQGTEEYGKQFRQWSDRWSNAAKLGRADFLSVGLDESSAVTDHDHDQLKSRLTELATSSTGPLWVVLIGHGTFDGKVARFNLRGPDVSLNEFSEWLKPVHRPLVLINCASCSGPFLTELAGKNRIVVTSTQSGHEYNFSRFGDYLSSAVADPSADLDKDEQTSLLEAFLMASARVKEFYDADGRLMTEHALLDDNGDHLGTPADWFQGVRAIKSAKSGAAVDGAQANQFQLIRSPAEAGIPEKVRVRRDQLEQELAELRRQKTQVSQEEYLQKIEPLLIELAKLYEAKGSPPSSNAY